MNWSPKSALADARAARDERDASLEQPAAQQRVEAGDRRSPARAAPPSAGGGDSGRASSAVAREDRDPARPDHHVVPALEVRGVPELVDLDVALALEPLLASSDRRMTPSTTVSSTPKRLIWLRAVGDVGGEEADRLGVLDDARELEDLLAADLRIPDLVQEHRDRVDGHAPAPHGLDRAPASSSRCASTTMSGCGMKTISTIPRSISRVEVPAEAARGGAQPLLGLLEREQDPLLAGQRAPVDELEREDRLARPRDAAR